MSKKLTYPCSFVLVLVAGLLGLCLSATARAGENWCTNPIFELDADGNINQNPRAFSDVLNWWTWGDPEPIELVVCSDHPIAVLQCNMGKDNVGAGSIGTDTNSEYLIEANKIYYFEADIKSLSGPGGKAGLVVEENTSWTGDIEILVNAPNDGSWGRVFMEVNTNDGQNSVFVGKGLLVGVRSEANLEHNPTGSSLVAVTNFYFGEGPGESSDYASFARNPSPKDGVTEVAIDTTLSWTPGYSAVKHELYFGTDFNDVNNADVNDTTGIYRGGLELDVTSYTPTETPLQWDQTYYWRVDEVNDAEPNSPWKGEVWSFTVANFIVVEDFEDYSDFPPNEIFNTWLDGWGDPVNGATSGYPAPDFVGGEHYLEGDIVHGGEFSFPLLYDNSAGISETTKTINADWTVDDVMTLTLFYYGDAGNAIEPMYVALDGDAVVTNDDPKATLDNEWNRWDILLQDFADMGVDLTNVNSMTIGFGDKANPTAGGEGMVLFDDIRLYRSAPIEIVPGPEPIDPGMTNVEVYYDFENDTQDNSGNGHHATAFNNPLYVSGLTSFGTALSLDGLNDYVELPIGSVINSLTDCTITAWVNWSGEGSFWQRIFDFGTPPASADEDPQIYMFLTCNAGSGSIRFATTISGNSDEDQTTASGVLSGRWHHVAVTIDPGNTTHTLYLDGKVVAQNTEARYTPSDLGQTTQNWLGKSQFSADPYFRGSLDEFYIFNRVLSENEILYLAGK